MRVRCWLSTFTAAFVAIGWGVIAQADAVTTGTAYSVAGYLSPGGPIPVHYHGFGTGLVEVGAFTGAPEEVRGLSEFSLAEVGRGSAYVSFDVYQEGGLFVPSGPQDPDRNNWPFDGIIDVFAYAGDNQPSIADFQAPTIAQVGSFSTVGLQAGQTLSFDVKKVLKDLLKEGDAALGIRLQVEGGAPANGGAYTFSSFRLIDGSSASVVPFPEAVWGSLALLGVLGFRRANRRNV